MKNSKLRRALLLVACAVLLVSISVSATLAYLTSKTEVVTNTFSVGNVKITLDEAAVNEYGKKLDKADKAEGDEGFNANNLKDRVTTNTYKLIPGHEYVKDPTIHVATATANQAASEDCWLFVKVENGIADIEAATTIANQMTADGKWTLVNNQTNVYAYKEIVSAGEDVVVFNTFKVDGNADVSTYASKTITVQAYAVQADGFTTAQAAWDAAPCTWGE